MHEQQHKGYLVICHGSRNEKWMQMIEECVNSVPKSSPLTIGFLEMIEGRTIADGVRYLEGQGVHEIVAIPFFVCSGSTHLNEIQYALGLLSTPAVHTDLELIHPTIPVIWSTPLDDHRLVLQLLEERIAEICVSPDEEALLIIAHGSNKRGFQEIWEEKMKALLFSLQPIFTFKDFDFATLKPDNIQEKAHKLSQNGRYKVLAMPVFLSQGYYTDVKIPEKLQSVPHLYQYKTYLPHQLMNQWLQEQMR